MHTIFPAWHAEYVARIDEEIRAFGERNRIGRSDLIFEPLIHSATRMGRKLRATLAMRYVDWQGYAKDEHYNVLLDALAAVEMLHSASCITDDIIDGDTQRRGHPVFHVREGLPQALLVTLEAVALAQSDAYQPLIGKDIPRRALGALFENMKKWRIDVKAKQLLDDTRQEILSAYPGKPATELGLILDTINRLEFWGYSYAP